MHNYYISTLMLDFAWSHTTHSLFVYDWCLFEIMLLFGLFIQLSETNGTSFGYGYNRTTSKAKSHSPDSSDDTQVSEGKLATWRLPHIYKVEGKRKQKSEKLYSSRVNVPSWCTEIYISA